MIFIPASKDVEQEKINGWMRTTGLTLLGFDENVKSLDKYLKEGEQKDRLFDYLATNIHTDISRFEIQTTLLIQRVLLLHNQYITP